ncbi:MAG: DUF2065 domain-containing protein [Pseudomonadota bacterium]
MQDFVTAIGLVLVIEGALYALFPEMMQRITAQVLEMSPSFLRRSGVMVAVVGFLIVWLIRA